MKNIHDYERDVETVRTILTHHALIELRDRVREHLPNLPTDDEVDLEHYKDLASALEAIDRVYDILPETLVELVRDAEETAL